MVYGLDAHVSGSGLGLRLGIGQSSIKDEPDTHAAFPQRQSTCLKSTQSTGRRTGRFPGRLVSRQIDRQISKQISQHKYKQAEILRQIGMSDEETSKQRERETDVTEAKHVLRQTDRQT